MGVCLFLFSFVPQTFSLRFLAQTGKFVLHFLVSASRITRKTRIMPPCVYTRIQEVCPQQIGIHVYLHTCIHVKNGLVSPNTPFRATKRPRWRGGESWRIPYAYSPNGIHTVDFFLTSPKGPIYFLIFIQIAGQ